MSRKQAGIKDTSSFITTSDSFGITDSMGALENEIHDLASRLEGGDETSSDVDTSEAAKVTYEKPNQTTHQRISSSITIKRELHILQLANQQLQSHHDQKCRAYELQVEALQETCRGLRQCGSEQERIIQIQLETIAKLKDRESTGSDLDQTVTVMGLHQLNTDLLVQNNQLRVENTHLQTRLACALPDEDNSSSLHSMMPGIPDTIKNEVDRILNPGTGAGGAISGYMGRVKKKNDMSTQTISDAIYKAQELAEKMKIERDKALNSYQMEKEINAELIVSVQNLKQEVDLLSTKFTSLSNDAEVAIASERVALEHIDKLEKQIHEKKQQLTGCSAELKNSLEQYQKLDKEYQIVKGANQVYQQKHKVASIDPLLFLETQWAKDRQEFYQATTALSGSLHLLETENKNLKKQVIEDQIGRIDQVEYAKLIGEHSIKCDELKKMDKRHGEAERDLSLSHARILKLETILDMKLKQIKDMNRQINNLESNISKKSELEQVHTAKIKTLAQNVEELASKCRLENSLITAKDHLVRDLKLKCKQLQTKLDTGTNTIHDTSLLQANLKEYKAQLDKKVVLIKHWRQKHQQVQQKLEHVIEVNKETIPLKQFTSLQAQSRVLKELNEKIRVELTLYKRRDDQYKSVLNGVIGDTARLAKKGAVLSSIPSMRGLDQTMVNDMAEKLSKELLHCEWGDINRGVLEVSHSEILFRLNNMLEKNDFEVDLYLLLTESLHTL